MKLIIQIPCFNEEETLPLTLAELPREVPGIDEVEWLIIDDGSRDRTAEVARANGVDHIVQFKSNQGLARAFLAGLDACLRAGADIIVNTDADNQYRADDISSLVQPVLAGTAEIVVGARPITEIEEFSLSKKILQRFGSWVVRSASSAQVPDAPSGFRAMSREAAMRLNVFSDYTYTLETIIQAGRKGIAIQSVPIQTNPSTRPSRLISSIPAYIRRSAETIVRISMTYRPFRFFAVPGILLLGAGGLIGLRFLIFYFNGAGGGHIQSLLLGTLLLGIGFFLLVSGLIADLLSVNRKLGEDIQYRIRRIEGQLEESSRRDSGGVSRKLPRAGAPSPQAGGDISQADQSERVGQAQ